MVSYGNPSLKYQRPVPGHDRMFVVSTSGDLTAFGPPVNHPLNGATALFRHRRRLGPRVRSIARSSPYSTDRGRVMIVVLTMNAFPALSTRFVHVPRPVLLTNDWQGAETDSHIEAIATILAGLGARSVQPLPLYVPSLIPCAHGMTDHLAHHRLGLSMGSRIPLRGWNERACSKNETSSYT